MNSHSKSLLPAAALDAAAFAEFGQVIARHDRSSYAINEGSSQRFSDLAQLEADAAGRLALSIFSAKARQAPFALGVLECHPLGSQAFMPLNGQSFLIVVAAARPDADRPDHGLLRAFLSDGQQGINFRRGIWHHPLIALTDGDFLVADRLGPGANCEEVDIAHWKLGIAL